MLSKKNLKRLKYLINNLDCSGFVENDCQSCPKIGECCVDSEKQNNTKWKSHFGEMAKKTYSPETKYLTVKGKIKIIEEYLKTEVNEVYICNMCTLRNKKPCIVISDDKPFNCPHSINNNYVQSWLTLGEFFAK